ncbi:hypothetical protein HYPP_01879 [Hyphomicrobium sp. ghe19]|nr:hypothetical protein HYPP_01879 [Hyphomicrobium sp. ghe19]
MILDRAEFAPIRCASVEATAGPSSFFPKPMSEWPLAVRPRAVMDFKMMVGEAIIGLRRAG